MSLMIQDSKEVSHLSILDLACAGAMPTLFSSPQQIPASNGAHARDGHGGKDGCVTQDSKMQIAATIASAGCCLLVAFW